MVSYSTYNLSANEGFVVFLASKLIICFTDSFTLEMKFQSIAYILNGSERIYLILDLEDGVHSTWVICTSGFQSW